MFKKNIPLFLVLILICSLFGCEKIPPSDSSGTNDPALSGMEPSFSDVVPFPYDGTSVVRIHNLPVVNPVQQFTFLEENGEQYVVVVQRVHSYAYISRCRVDEKQKTATMVDNIILDGAGRTASLHFSVYKGSLYLFISDDENENYPYGCTNVSRLKYENGSFSEIKFLTGLQCLNQNGTMPYPWAQPCRTEMALNDEANQITFYGWIGPLGDTENADYWLASFRLSLLHEAFNRIGDREFLNLSDLTDKNPELFLATSGKQTADMLCPFEAFQGMEVLPDGTVCMLRFSVNDLPRILVFKRERQTIQRADSYDLYSFYSSRLGVVLYPKEMNRVSLVGIRYYRGEWYCALHPVNGTQENATEIIWLHSIKI